MLRDNDIPIGYIGFQSLKNLSSPAPFLERFSFSLGEMYLSHVLPSVIVANLPLLMETIVNWDLVCSCGSEELSDMLDSVLLFQAVGEQTIQLTIWVKEVIVGVDKDDCGVGRHVGRLGRLMGLAFVLFIRRQNV